jgi:hypothetical protein
MSARSVSLGSMFDWISDSFRLLGRNFLTFMAASGLSLLLGILLFLPVMLVMMATMAPQWQAGATGAMPMGGNLTLFWALYGLTIIVALLAFPPLAIGWYRLCRDLDQGIATSALNILQPYRDRPLWIRGVGFALLAFAIVVVVMCLFGLAFYAPISEFMNQVAAQQAAALTGAAPAPPQFSMGLAAAYFCLIAVMIVLQFMLRIGFADFSLHGTSVIPALTAAAGGVFKNALKLLVFVFCVGLLVVVAAMLIGIVLALLMGLLTLLSPKLAIVAAVLLYLPFLLCIYPLSFAGHYFVWKSILGQDSPAPEQAGDSTFSA